jgi:hypothetical protein
VVSVRSTTGSVIAVDSDDCQADRNDGTIPVDAVPKPLARYAVRDDTVVLTEANDRFESTFAVGAANGAFRTWWAENELAARDRDIDELCQALVAGDPVDVFVSADGTGAGADGAGDCTYRFEASGTRDQHGTIVVTEVPMDRGDDFGGEQIASVISHDLRNPLDVAKAHLQAARETGEQTHFDSLEQAHDRMERIIQDVLTLARREGVISPSPAVEIDTIAADAWETVDTPHASLTLGSDLPAITADPDRLQRLFENLFRNSAEHGRTDGPVAEGRGSSVPDQDGLTIRVGTIDGGFYVADDGPGVPQDERAKVFDPGYTDADGGTGLGLTIVERIAVAHGWTVTLRNGEGGGARFEFRGVESSTQ